MKKFRIIVETDGFGQYVYVQERMSIGFIRWWEYKRKMIMFDISVRQNFQTVEAAKEHIDRTIQHYKKKAVPTTTEIINYP